MLVLVQRPQHKSTPDPVAAQKNIPFGTISFNPSGTIRKKFLLCKSTKKARYVRSLGKKLHFWPSQRLKKVLLTAQGCARLHTGPIITQIPRGYQKKSLLCRKARYVRSLGKKPHFWPSQRLKKVLLTEQGCARLRTGPIIMQIPRGYQKKKFIV